MKKNDIAKPENPGGAEEGRPPHTDGRAADLRLLPLEREDSRPAHGGNKIFSHMVERNGKHVAEYYMGAKRKLT